MNSFCILFCYSGLSCGCHGKPCASGFKQSLLLPIYLLFLLLLVFAVAAFLNASVRANKKALHTFVRFEQIIIRACRHARNSTHGTLLCRSFCVCVCNGSHNKHAARSCCCHAQLPFNRFGWGRNFDVQLAAWGRNCCCVPRLVCGSISISSTDAAQHPINFNCVPPKILFYFFFWLCFYLYFV